MDLNRFKECCTAFGAERRRWPAHEHALYDRLAGTAQGAAILAEAERTDRFLDAFEAGVPDAQLARRIGAQARPAWRRLGAPTAALTASAVLGFALGFVQARDAADSDAVAQLLLGPRSLQEIGP